LGNIDGLFRTIDRPGDKKRAARKGRLSPVIFIPSVNRDTLPCNCRPTKKAAGITGGLSLITPVLRKAVPAVNGPVAARLKRYLRLTPAGCRTRPETSPVPDGRNSRHDHDRSVCGPPGTPDNGPELFWAAPKIMICTQNRSGLYDEQIHSPVSPCSILAPPSKPHLPAGRPGEET